MNEEIVVNDKRKVHDLYNEMKDSFLDYSMSVIVSRAIPDVRDGLKPVHRRILYTMFEEGMTYDRKHQKAANAVGAIMGHYHPHGDTAIYDSMVRMAQEFTYRHMLVDGHGNFGSVDGDPAAAYRYTEVRLSKIAGELLKDINKNTVDFDDNYDGQRKEPKILPSRFPNILVNGNMGIAVGMATNIPPHNLGEVIDATIAFIDNPDIDTEGLMQHLKGPDFPTGAFILGNSGIRRAYETGKGSITIRSKVEIEEHKGHSRIIITELPYQVNKKSLITRIAELVRDKIVDGISNLNDASSLEGIRIVIDIKKDANANVVLNNLFKHTQLQMSYGINFLMLVDGKPKTIGIKEILTHYVNYQQSVIVRRTQFELDRAEKRAHVLEGLKIALDNIDDIIKIIKESGDDAEIIAKFNSKYGLSETQSQAILEMKLRRLSGLERSKIEEELAEIMKLIEELRSILASNDKVMMIIKDEMTEIKNRYADERRTVIDMTAIEFIEDESLIPEENIMLTLTNKGYIKRATADTYKSQNRGGVGVKGMSTNEEDFVEHMINLSTHDYVTFFTNRGKIYRMKGYEIPEFGRQSKGIPIVNLLQVDKDEVVNSVLKYTEGEEETKYLLFVTKNGIVKKTAIEEFSSIRATGKICITLKENDELISVKKTSGEESVLIGAENGKMCRFHESEIRVMGRTASGVKGMNLDGSKCIGAEIATEDETVIIVTVNGYGKKTKVIEFRGTKRGSKGVKALNITDKNGIMSSFKIERENKDIVIITDSGMIMRMPTDQITLLSRSTQGVRLIKLKSDQKVSTISLVDKADDNLDDIAEEENNNE